MKRLKKLMDSPKATMAVFGAAALLLAASTIGGARAAQISREEDFRTGIATTAVSTALVEANAGTGAEGAGRNGSLLSGMLPENETVKPGKKYEERLSVENTGTTDQYVRVTLYRYWTREVKAGAGTDAGGTEAPETVTVKERDADPGYIRLNLLAADGSAEKADALWVVDGDASTAERTVLYYTRPLGPGERAVFADGLVIDSAVAGVLKTGADGTKSYFYKDLSFRVRAEVDAVQPRHTEEAILSAWGREVNIDGEGNLSLAPRRDKVVWEGDTPSVSGNEGGENSNDPAGSGAEGGDSSQTGTGGNA